MAEDKTVSSGKQMQLEDAEGDNYCSRQRVAVTKRISVAGAGHNALVCPWVLNARIIFCSCVKHP